MSATNGRTAVIVDVLRTPGRPRPQGLLVIELNEAFAAQVIPVLESVGVNPCDERVNPFGGAAG